MIDSEKLSKKNLLLQGENESLNSQISLLKKLLTGEKERQKQIEQDNTKINQQLASALSSTSLQVESLRRQLSEVKQQRSKNSPNSRTSAENEIDNLTQEILKLTNKKMVLEGDISRLQVHLLKIDVEANRYDGMDDSTLRKNLGVSEVMINRLHEELNVSKSEVKDLRSDKEELIIALKQIHETLNKKNYENEQNLKEYKKKLGEKENIITNLFSELNDVKEDQTAILNSLRLSEENSRKLKAELDFHQLTEINNTKRAQSPSISSTVQSSSVTKTNSSPNYYNINVRRSAIEHDDALSNCTTTTTTITSDYSDPIKKNSHQINQRSNSLKMRSPKAPQLTSPLKPNSSKETKKTTWPGQIQESAQYATVGPPLVVRNRYHSYSEQDDSQCMENELNEAIWTGKIPQTYSSFRVPSNKQILPPLRPSLSADNVCPPLPVRSLSASRASSVKKDINKRNESTIVDDTIDVRGSRQRSLSLSNDFNIKAKNKQSSTQNFFSISKIFNRKKKKQHSEVVHQESHLTPVYCNITPSPKKILQSTPRQVHTRPAPPPPSSLSLQDNLTINIFGSEERKIGLLEETKKVHISRWNQITVLAWMDVRLGLTQYIEKGLQTIQSGQTLLELDDTDYYAMLGIKNILHKRKLKLAIDQYRNLQKFDACLAINELDHIWISQIWLPRLGLGKHLKVFIINLIDGRMLNSLQKREIEELLHISSRIEQLSLINGISLLQKLNFSKEAWHENLNTEPIYWDNERIHLWLQSIDLLDFAENVLSSGVHGALMCLEPTFTYETLANIIGIPIENKQQRKLLRQQFASLRSTFNGVQMPIYRNIPISRSYSVPRTSTSPFNLTTIV